MSLSFGQPLVLFLLLLPALLVLWVWLRRGRRVVLPFDHGRQRGGALWLALVNAAEMLPALLLAVAVVLLAGPQRLSEPKTKRRLTNIEFCVDVSGSMTAPFGDGTRYDASMKAINEFLDYRKGDAFGLTFFGHNPLHWVPLTTDTSAIRCSPPFMRPEMLPPDIFGGTEIGKALLACKEVLSVREEGDRMIILVSDGISADLFNGNDITVANTLKKHNIAVYAIHIGGGEVPGEIINITSITGGEAFQSVEPEVLKHIFQRIDRMQQARLEKTQAETLDHFAPVCLAGLSLLGLAVLSMFGLRYTPW